MLENGYKGIIAEQTSDTDYQLGGALLLPVPEHTFESSGQIQYLQDEVSHNSCTLHGSLTAVSALTGYKFTLDERKALWEQAKGVGWKDSNGIVHFASDITGWYVNAGVDLVRQYWNSKNPENQLVSFRIDMGSADWNTVISKNYNAVVGFNGNGDYNADYLKDGQLDGTDFGAPMYGHCVDIKDKDTLVKDEVVDSFYNGLGNPNNIYAIPKSNISALVKNGVYFQSAYVFCYEKDYNQTQIMQNVSPWAVASVQKAIAKGLDISNPQAEVTPAQLAQMAFTLGKFQSTGILTQERMAVFLDRLNALG